MMPEGYYFSPESFIKTNSFEKNVWGMLFFPCFDWNDLTFEHMPYRK